VRDEYAIPVLRDLPGDRLAERKRHLVAEIAQPSLRRRIPPRAVLVLVAAFVVVVVGTATAFGTVRNLLSGPRVNSQIAYIHKTTGRNQDGRSELWVMNADGSGERMLARGGVPYSGLVFGDWSPDGRRIAFIKPYSTVYETYSTVYVMNADGSGQRRLTQGGELGGLRWSPDGRKILLSCLKCAASPRSRFSGWGELYVMNADGSEPRNLTRDPRVEGSPEWSPDGRKIAFARLGPSGGGRSEIVVMNADGSGKRTLADRAGGPVWSPDGRKIAFTKPCCGAAPVEGDIYVMNADGSGQRRLTRNELPDGGPAWSPDGQQILFVRGGWRRARLYVMNADGSEQRNLGVHAHGGAWSPDGRLIAFTRERGFEVAVMNADGSGLRDLTHSRTGNFFGAWAPGRRGG
jgi:Tol biopolymer transport system component